jgi:prolyl-tRNA synthetase
MRPRVFLRTTEFLWQEGHTAHASEKEALQETMTMLEVYRSFAQDVLAISVIPGEKPAHERFPGAEKTFCIEAMMQDRKALQAGTSHYLGQNFAKAAGIKFTNQSGGEEYVYTTSWGVSTRLIGAVVMAHSDDDGLRLPPRIAPKQVVIIPMRNEVEITEYCESLANEIKEKTYERQAISVYLDTKDIRSVEKKWKAIKKGIPLILEIGPRDTKSKNVTVMHRDRLDDEPFSISREEFIGQVSGILTQIQQHYFQDSQKFLEANTKKDIQNFDEFRAWFGEGEEDSGQGSFVLAKWSENPATLEKLSPLKVSIRCLPFQQSGTIGKCILSGAEAKADVIFARAY